MTPTPPLRFSVSHHSVLVSFSPVCCSAAQYLNKPAKGPFKGKALLSKDLLRPATFANPSSWVRLMIFCSAILGGLVQSHRPRCSNRQDLECIALEFLKSPEIASLGIWYSPLLLFLSCVYWPFGLYEFKVAGCGEEYVNKTTTQQTGPCCNQVWLGPGSPWCGWCHFWKKKVCMTSLLFSWRGKKV